ncbi:patatin-like phospholipase family protein [Actinocrispum sp. NPDC049592]|uniref:patatin-like phospholipase family protein n=1 Tax=Actinocrispum sp. NPDC049592 TaxID=3154835 RepID=UPI003421DD40
MSRAVVIGGGGHTGFGWQWGVITGLWECGVDLATADLVVGTSTGSMAAVHLAADGTPEAMMAHVTAPPSGHDPEFDSPTNTFGLELGRMIKSGYTAEAIRAEMGRIALTAEARSETLMREISGTYLPHEQWPARRVLIPAIDAETGEFVVFDQESGVRMVDAVCATCALPGVWEPVTINGRRYIDPFIRSPINADLAAGFEHVVVIASIAEIRGLPGGSLDEQLAPVLQDGKVTVIVPDQAAMAAIGRDQQDLSRRPAAAKAGHAQAPSLVAELGDYWHD